MRILVLLNEKEKRSHTDVYDSFDYCLKEKLISDYAVYPFLFKLKELKNERFVNKDIVDFYEAYKPDPILWMHTTGLKIYNDTISYIKQHNPLIVMGYWEGDAFHKTIKPIPRHVLELARICNVLFLQDFSCTKNMFELDGCKDIRYTPAVTDTRYFKIIKGEKKHFKAVMIGNRIIRRNPFKKRMPGVHLREEIVKIFSQQYEDLFAIFGTGWKSKSAKGYIDYSKQSLIYSQSKISVGVNNILGKYYFSSRLPIAMSSGIPILHSAIEGSDRLFKRCKELIFFENSTEAMQLSRNLLNKEQLELDEIGKYLADYANRYFTGRMRFSYIVKVLSEFLPENEMSKVINPWIG